MSDPVPATIELLTRAGCAMCERANRELTDLRAELGFEYRLVDVDEPGNRELRAEYGDSLPVVLLDGAEHSFWEVDADRLRADLAR